MLSRKVLLVLSVFAIGLSLYCYVRMGPRLTLDAIKAASESEEKESLDGYVDFERFRDSVHLMVATMMQKSTDESGEPADDGLMLADKIWIGMFFANFSSELESENASQHFNSWSNYSVFLPHNNEHGYELILERYCISWKLCEVRYY